MDEQMQDRRVIVREEVEQFRSQVRFLLDEMQLAVDAPDNAPWVKPGDITVPIEAAIDEITQSIARMIERLGRLTCESCGTALGWDDLGRGHTRCAACTSSYAI